MSIQEQLTNQQDPAAALALIIAEFKADSGTIHQVGDDGDLHLLAASDGIPEHVLEIIRTIPAGRGMAGEAVSSRGPVTSCNIQEDDSEAVRPGAKQTGLEGAIVVPMFDGHSVVGALGIANRTEREFTPQETVLLIDCGRLIAPLARS